jgi:hypothetical protein
VSAYVGGLDELIALRRAGVRPGETYGQTLAERVVEFQLKDLKTSPPARKYVLHDSRTARGVLTRGKVALFAGKGGSGKTKALIQLAVAKAVGGVWLGPGGWETRAPGRVLLVLGEEERDECLRRIHDACLGLSDRELALVQQNLSVLPLAGVSVALTFESKTPTGLPETARAEELRQVLQAAQDAGRPYEIVIIDPLSRFAGPDVEKDNSAATRFIQVLETLCTRDCGEPAVICAHHVRKLGQNEDAESGDGIRGASGLPDGARWAAVMVQLKPYEGAPDLVRIRVTKTNYAMCPEPLTLCRPLDGNGTLRVATVGEIAIYDEAKRARRGGGGTGEDLKSLVLASLQRFPESGTAVAERVCRGKQAVLNVIKDLATGGRVVRVGRDWRVSTGTVPTVPDGSEPIPKANGSGSPSLDGNREPEPFREGDECADFLA